jgi:predicted transcriptional regulator
VVNEKGVLIGVITRRDVHNASNAADLSIEQLIRRPPKFVYDDCTVREAADHMVNHNIGRLPVIRRDRPTELIGMLTRSDILSVFQKGLRDAKPQSPTIRLPGLSRRRSGAGSGRAT